MQQPTLYRESDNFHSEGEERSPKLSFNEFTLVIYKDKMDTVKARGSLEAHKGQFKHLIA